MAVSPHMFSWFTTPSTLGSAAIPRKNAAKGPRDWSR